MKDERNEDEVVLELNHEDGAPDENPEAKLKKLRDELTQCRQEKQEYRDGWQRAKADYVNATKRFGDDLKTAGLRGKIQAVETLLPAFDALERAKDHGEVPEGFAAIARQLEGAFSTLGLEAIGAAGEAFDPLLHEALGEDAVESKEQDHTVTVVLEKGWRVGQTIIRPAKVRVGHYEASSGL